MDSERTKKRLEDFKFIPFYKALTTGDFKPLEVTEDEFFDLTDKYLEETDSKKDSSDKQLDKIAEDLTLLRASLVLLLREYDDEVANIVHNLGVTYLKDNEEDGARNIIKAISDKVMLQKALRAEKPKIPEAVKNTSAYDILANLSMNLEFGINFAELNVLEYLSYNKAVNKKIKSLKSN